MNVDRRGFLGTILSLPLLRTQRVLREPRYSFHGAGRLLTTNFDDGASIPHVVLLKDKVSIPEKRQGFGVSSLYVTMGGVCEGSYSKLRVFM